MAWEKAQIRLTPASIGTGIKVSLKRTNKSDARMTFTISNKTGTELGWVQGDKFEVMFGTGEHHGLMRLRKNNSVGEAVLDFREMAKGSWFTLRMGEQPAFVNRSESAAWCQWEKVEDGWLEIVLPKWADETGVKKAALVPTKMPISAPQLPVRRAETVTASVMGDPPPGRREMLEKIGKVRA